VTGSGRWDVDRMACSASRWASVFTVAIPSSAPHWSCDHRETVGMEFCQPGSLSDLSEQSAQAFALHMRCGRETNGYCFKPCDLGFYQMRCSVSKLSQL
jgi:hypothetical protein